MNDSTTPIVIDFDIKELAKSNLIVTIGLSLLFIAFQILLHKNIPIHFSIMSIIWNTALFFILYVILIVLHEVFHLIGFMIFGRVPFQQLKYGLNLSLGVAYATTEQPLRNKTMQHALLLPFWTTGVAPAIIGFYFNNTVILLVAAFLIAGAVGDFSMYKELRKFPVDALIKDDPKLPRLYVYLNEKS